MNMTGKRLAGVALAASMAGSSWAPPVALAGETVSPERCYEIGVDAYIYAYPMVVMEITRRVTTNVESPTGVLGPVNHFAHVRTFPDHTFREVVRPNADTLYSSLWFDVSKEPLVITAPDTGNRYYMLPMMDMWTDVFAAPGNRTSGTKAAGFAIVGPEWKGSLSGGLQEIRSPTSIGWIIGRTNTKGPADYPNVHRIQDGFTATPLSQWGKSRTTPAKARVNPGWDMKTPPPMQVAKMSAAEYFELFADLLKDNPPHEMDWNIVTQLEQIGIVAGEDLDFSRLAPETQAALERSVSDAQERIKGAGHHFGDFVDGWQVARDGMGTYGASYLARAFVAMIGLGANLPEDAVYPMSHTDAEGTPYNGSHRYRIHFDKGQIPPVRAFWSLSVYDAEGYFAENPINRYAIGDRDKLSFNDDGSLDLYLQHESPGNDMASNWLPVPADDFNLILRLYWPNSEILTGAWNPPPVKRQK